MSQPLDQHTGRQILAQLERIGDSLEKILAIQAYQLHEDVRADIEFAREAAKSGNDFDDEF